MTQEILEKKVNECLDDAINQMKNRIKKIYKSNAYDLSKYGDNYELPKMIICASMKQASRLFEPFHDKKKMKEVEKFIEESLKVSL